MGLWPRCFSVVRYQTVETAWIKLKVSGIEPCGETLPGKRKTTADGKPAVPNRKKILENICAQLWFRRLD